MFDGTTYNHARDGKRLSYQLDAVRDLMSDGLWRTLWDIAEETDFPEASISARLRDLRKHKFGGHRVDRRYTGGGLWEYRVL